MFKLYNNVFIIFFNDVLLIIYNERFLNIAVNITLLIYLWTSRSPEKPMDEFMYAPKKKSMDVGKNSDKAKEQEIDLRMSEAISHHEDQFFANPGYAPWHQRLTRSEGN